MEILAVLLVIAVVTSMAIPVLRSVRFEMRNSQAKAGAKKLAEAVKTYYNASRGCDISGCFTPTETVGGQTFAQRTAPTACASPSDTGIPSPTCTAPDVQMLFNCGFLSYKDFANLPYRFCTFKPTNASLPADPSTLSGRYYAVVYGASPAAGTKFQPAKGFIYVDERMTPLDTYE